VTAAGRAALGPRHHEVKRLRALLRDSKARASERAFVLEGPRLLEDALRRGVSPSSIYLGTNAETAFRSVLTRPEVDGVPVAKLKEGVLEKLGSTRTPQPVLSVVPIPAPVTVEDLSGAGPVVVVVDVADPGNLGTLLRSVEAGGAVGVVCCGDTVDAYNPKVVRASAGSVLGVPVVEAGGAVPVLEVLRRAGRRCLGATSRGEPAPAADLAGPVALVLGNEAHGLPEVVLASVDGLVAVPMAGAGESLNVAMAGTVLLFEAARQRAARGA
jgi:TrmH family RNA methyltransferase